MLQETTFAWRKQKLQNMLHTPYMNDDYCSQCEENKTKQKSRKLHALFWQEQKKIENETEKKTLLQLTTYVMCHKFEQWF